MNTSTTTSISGISTTSLRRSTSSLATVKVIVGAILVILPLGTSFTAPLSSPVLTACASTPPPQPNNNDSLSTRTKTTRLFMGKGLNKIKGKQADLKRKMELAKQQKREASGESTDDDDSVEALSCLTEEEIKERNDRKRFEQLLEREGTKMLNDYDSDGYLSIKQEEEEITAARAGVDRIFEGDPAPVDCFENLVDATTENIIAKKGAGRLVPWLSKDYDIDPDDYRVIISDPRKQSTELHQAIKDLHGSLPGDIKDRLYYINADTSPENRRWLKKNGLQGMVNIYSDDEGLTWMRRYTALGDDRWSMTMFIIRKGKVVKLARELDIYNASRAITNAVKAMKNEAV